jgi:type VI secretion system protein ImpM
VPLAEVAGSGQVPAPQAAVGLFGKIPARGDFVRAGLPRDFVQPWDDWLQQVIAGSKAQLGERWVPAWMEAPIWRFALPGGMCGTAPVFGVWMPSVDRAGRHFPLTLAMVVAPGDARAAEMALGWLPQAEAAGLAALSDDLAPEAVAARLAPDGAWPDVAAAPDLSALANGQAVWWTEGAPLVPAGHCTTPALPDVDAFMKMLDATSTPGAAPEPGAGGNEATEGM